MFFDQNTIDRGTTLPFTATSCQHVQRVSCLYNQNLEKYRHKLKMFLYHKTVQLTERMIQIEFVLGVNVVKPLTVGLNKIECFSQKRLHPSLYIMNLDDKGRMMASQALTKLFSCTFYLLPTNGFIFMKLQPVVNAIKIYGCILRQQQGIFTEVEGSVQLTSLYQLFEISCFLY